MHPRFLAVQAFAHITQFVTQLINLLLKHFHHPRSLFQATATRRIIPLFKEISAANSGEDLQRSTGIELGFDAGGQRLIVGGHNVQHAIQLRKLIHVVDQGGVDRR